MRHEADHAAEGGHVDVVDVDAGDGEGAPRNGVKTEDQSGEGGFPGAGDTN